MATSALKERLRAGGILRPGIAIAEAKRAGLPLELACALLEQESSGGRNVYGHDPSIFRGAGRVTRENYAEYKRRRLASRNTAMQGVGPCQLTWWEFQDAADRQGGCWRPAINMRVGFGHLATLVKRYGEADGARRYNGSGAAAEQYSRELIAKARRWEAVIDGAQAPAGADAARRRPRRGDGEKRVERPPRRPEPRKPADGAPVNGAAKKPPKPAERRPVQPRLTAMAADLREREADADRVWRKLVAYGHRQRRRLLAEQAEIEAGEHGMDPQELSALLAALARIEGKLGTLVDISWRRPDEPPVPEGPLAPAAPPAMRPPAAAAPEGTTAAEAPAATATAVRTLPEYQVPELVREVEVLEARARELRGELIERYEKVDEQLVRLLGPRARPLERRDDRGSAHGVRDRRRRPDSSSKVQRASRSERDPLGGRSASTVRGDRGLLVRRSKIALARFLAKKGSAEHASLRRTLRREAAKPRTGDVASPAWGRAVEAAQHITGRPVTGELDGDLARILQPYWPRDNAGKRMVRSTPAWRAIPGQLTPNFNVKEFACKDPARTPYITGLMREQGLSKKEARARALGLAKRLERLRKLNGDRPLVITSAYRTRAHNATLTGSATNSAHTKGYAADVPPPRGVSLSQHKAHAAQAFECGIGYYAPGQGNFVHCDFDSTLGRRFW